MKTLKEELNELTKVTKKFEADLKISKPMVQRVLKEYNNVMSKLLEIYEIYDSGKNDIDGVDINHVFKTHVHDLFEKASDKLYKKGFNATQIIFITEMFGDYTEFVKNTIILSLRPVDEHEWKLLKDVKGQAMEKIWSITKSGKIDFFS